MKEQPNVPPPFPVGGISLGGRYVAWVGDPCFAIGIGQDGAIRVHAQLTLVGDNARMFLEAMAAHSGLTGGVK